MEINYKIVPLPLLKEENGSLLQCFDIFINIDEADQLQKLFLIVIRNNKELKYDLRYLKNGENRKEIFLPEILKDEENDFILIYGGKKIIQKIFIQPVRHWTIHLVLHSHTDLGFTAPVSDVAQIHNDNTDVALLYCKETEHWSEGSRFKWTCEVSWQIQNYIRDRSPQKVEDLMHQVRKENIEIGALYSGELTEILGHEQAVRSFYYAAKLRRDYKINIQTAMLCDVPGCTKGFVQIMAKSGIKNFIVADNNFIAPFLPRTDLPRPFYWVGDDDTKILSWYTDHPFYAYIEGENYGLSFSYSETRNKLPYKLMELEKDGYAFDEFQLQYAFDNFRIEFRPAAIVREWNEKWVYPKIKISTASEFLNSVREKHDSKIPERKGDWTNWWSGIVTGFPYETAQSRLMHNKIPSLEILNSSLKLIDSSLQYYSDSFESLYDQTLAFDEHSGSGMVWEAKSEEQQHKALTEGYGFIHNSFNEAGKVEKNLEDKLSPLFNNENSSEKIAVLNTLNFQRSGFVEINPNKKNIYLIDKTSGRKVHVIRENNKVKIYAEDVPPLGFKIYEVFAGNYQGRDSVASSFNEKELILENTFYKITADKSTGKIVSIFSKEVNTEILEEHFNYPHLYTLKPKVPFQLGKFVPELYNGDEVPGEIKCFNNLDVKLSLQQTEPGRPFLLTDFSFDDNVWLKQKIFPENDTIKIENTINGELLNDTGFLKKYLNDSGQLYFEFGFNVSNPQLRYDAPASVIEPKKEQFKGACKDYYAIQNWCQIYNEEIAVNFSSTDAPLIDIGEIALMKYRNDFTSTPEKLFVRGFSLNEFNGKGKSPYTKNPDLTFRFSISAQKFNDEASLASAHKFGQENNQKLYGVVIPANNKGTLKEIQNSFYEITPDHLHIMTIKKAEDSDDLIIRIRETIGVQTEANIKIPDRKILEAYKTMMTEENIENLEITGNSILLQLNPFAVETVRLKLEQ